MRSRRVPVFAFKPPYDFVEYAVKGGGGVTRFEIAGGRVAGMETKPK